MDYDDEPPDSSPEATQARKGIEEAKAEAEAELLRQCSQKAESIDELMERAELEARVWSLRSQAAAAVNNTAQAVAYGKQAVAFGDLAVKLSKNTLADRVTTLERALASGKTKGGRIRAAGKRRAK